jgi:hypothetical protein
MDNNRQGRDRGAEIRQKGDRETKYKKEKYRETER